MFAPTLLRKRPAMQPEASPTDNDDAGVEDPPPGGRSRGRAARFQYATGDKPLDGYTIKRGVGRGGFGEVYFATSDAGKEVALKLIRRNLDIELRGVRQCLNLKHPNLVSLYDLRADSADDQWVVMEYVSGESLEEAIDRHPEGMPIELAIEWLRGIAAGVGYLHSSGIVHRDLKPGNVYLERGAGSVEPRVKIGDYGLAKFISASRRSGQTESVGTVHYMAPEISGGRYGREIDTYALGVILYEMLTGHVPFVGESVGEVLMKHLTAEPDLSRLAEPYRTIVARALAKDPETRLSSVEEMLALLPSAEPSVAAPAAAPITPTVGEVWSPVSRPPHTDHPTPQREPLWAAMVELLETSRRNWAQWNAPPLMKGLVLLSGVGVLFFSGIGFALPMAILPLYLVYYVVWALFFQDAAPATAAPAEAAPTALYARTNKPSTPHRKRYDWRAVAKRLRRSRTVRQKATTLTGSMLGSALISILAGAVAGPLLADSTAADAASLGVWFAAVATLGSWGVLLSSAAAETHFEDHLPRRGMQLLAGMIVGAAAFSLMVVLGGELPFGRDWSPMGDDVTLVEAFDIDLYRGVEMNQRVVAVPITASLAYFAALFGLLRWWRTAEYIRRSRVSLWTIAAAVVGAWLLCLVTWYPQPLGLVLAGVIAAAVQISSPWCPPSRRAALARGEAPVEA